MKSKYLIFIITTIMMALCTTVIIVKIEQNVKPPIKVDNKIIKLTYDINNNFYFVLYTKHNDTLGLDFVHPYELDSLVETLNR